MTVDVQGIALKMLLECPDRDVRLKAFSDLKAGYFTSTYSPIYRAIRRHYLKYSDIPTLSQLEITTRETQLSIALNVLRNRIELPEDVSMELALEALENIYAQNEFLTEVDKILAEVDVLDSTELLEKVNMLSMTLEDRLESSETLIKANELKVFPKMEDKEVQRVFTGISNKYDSVCGGYYIEDLILVGGKRGAGKSLFACNLAASQYEQGYVVPYFTIEMKGQEILDRMTSILAEINAQHLRSGELTPEEKVKMAKYRAKMFEDADDVLEKFLAGTMNEHEFEDELIKTKRLKQDNQIVIIDDRDLSISSIDLHIQKLKGIHGDKLKLVIVDYLNQLIDSDPNDIYDWKAQVNVSKKLKNLARKHKVVIVSPFQIDSSGEARFSKGILDAADIAIILDAHEKSDGIIQQTLSKARGVSDEFVVANRIDWNCLRIYPQEVILKDAKEDEEPERKSFKKKPQEEQELF